MTSILERCIAKGKVEFLDGSSLDWLAALKRRLRGSRHKYAVIAGDGVNVWVAGLFMSFVQAHQFQAGIVNPVVTESIIYS